MSTANVVFSSWVGAKVTKAALSKGTRAAKPFKSGLRINTVKACTTSPFTQKPAFIFEEDDSIVDCHICVRVG